MGCWVLGCYVMMNMRCMRCEIERKRTHDMHIHMYQLWLTFLGCYCELNVRCTRCEIGRPTVWTHDEISFWTHDMHRIIVTIYKLTRLCRLFSTFFLGMRGTSHHGGSEQKMYFILRESTLKGSSCRRRCRLQYEELRWITRKERVSLIVMLWKQASRYTTSPSLSRY